MRRFVWEFPRDGVRILVLPMVQPSEVLTLVATVFGCVSLVDQALSDVVRRKGGQIDRQTARLFGDVLA